MKVMDIIQRMTLARSVMIGLVIAAIYYFVMYDSGKNQKALIQSTKTQITDLESKVAEAQKKLDRAAVYKTTVAEVGGAIKKLLSVIPEKFGSADLMKMLSNEAKVAGSSLNSITPGKSSEVAFAKEFEEFSVTIDMNGSFLQHIVFLSNLTKINQILIVRSIGLSSEVAAAKSEDAVNVHMVAEIVAYRYKGTDAANPAGGQTEAPQ